MPQAGHVTMLTPLRLRESERGRVIRFRGLPQASVVSNTELIQEVGVGDLIRRQTVPNNRPAHGSDAGRGYAKGRTSTSIRFRSMLPSLSP